MAQIQILTKPEGRDSQTTQEFWHTTRCLSGHYTLVVWQNPENKSFYGRLSEVVGQNGSLRQILRASTSIPGPKEGEYLSHEEAGRAIISLIINSQLPKFWVAQP